MGDGSPSKLKMKKIGIKYCRGCNPTYERVELIQRVQSLMEDRLFFLQYDQHDLDSLLLINGCPRACAGENLNQPEVPYCSIIRENDLEDLVDWLMALEEKGEKNETDCYKR